VKPDQSESDTQDQAWVEHDFSQLVYFQSLSLREKMHAVQGMADVVRRFAEMRANGQFRSLSENRRTLSTLPSQTARGPDVPCEADPREDESA
jgi:hypothetical protein